MNAPLPLWKRILNSQALDLLLGQRKAQPAFEPTVPDTVEENSAAVRLASFIGNDRSTGMTAEEFLHKHRDRFVDASVLEKVDEAATLCMDYDGPMHRIDSCVQGSITVNLDHYRGQKDRVLSGDHFPEFAQEPHRLVAIDPGNVLVTGALRKMAREGHLVLTSLDASDRRIAEPGDFALDLKVLEDQIRCIEIESVPLKEKPWIEMNQPNRKRKKRARSDRKQPRPPQPRRPF